MPEFWEILDENGNPTGRIHERGKPIRKGEFHLALYVWIQNDAGKYLISQRSANKSYPHMWECTGGNAVVGDDSLTTALKETQEELGIILDPQNGKMLHHHLRHGDHDGRGLADVWLFRQNVDISTVILDPEETCDARWATREEINRMIDEGTFTTWNLAPYIDALVSDTSPD